MGDIPETTVNVNARLELLRGLAEWRDFLPTLRETCPNAPEFEALDGHSMPPAWRNPWEDIVVAAKECEALGLIRVNRSPLDECPGDWGVAITDAGYDWIKAHDLAGEVAQAGRAPGGAGREGA